MSYVNALVPLLREGIHDALRKAGGSRERKWIADRRELESLLHQMRQISWEAGGYLLEATATPSDSSAPPAQPPKPRRR